MNTGIIVGIVGVIAVVGGIVGADSVKASKDAAAAHLTADKLEREATHQKELTEKAEKEEQDLMNDLQPREAMGVEIDKWQSEETKLLEEARAARTAWSDSVAEMQSILKPLRATTQAKPLTSVTLKSGIPLRNCVIAGVEGGQITLKHQDGITKVAARDLPFELVRRYYLNFDPSLPQGLEEPDLTPVAVVMPEPEPPPPPLAAGKNTPEGTELRRAEQRMKALRYQLKQFEQAKEYQLSLCHLFANPPDNEKEKIHFAKGLENAQAAGRRYVEKIKSSEAELAKLDLRVGALRAKPGAR